MKKIIKIGIPIFILIIVYIYVLMIESIPNNITIFQGENIQIKQLWGIGLNKQNNEEIVEASSNKNQNTINQVNTEKIKISLLDKINIKNVNIDILPKTKVIPVGSVAGVKLYTNGVLVVGMSEIEGEDSKIYKPYEETGIKEGDTIISINQTKINTTDDLIKEVNNSKGENIKVKYIHDEKTLECCKFICFWVVKCDCSYSCCTVSDPKSYFVIFFSCFYWFYAALGHGILDIDTEKLINISSGEFVTTNILKIEKGEKGNPGRIQGTLEKQKEIGKIKQNTGFGIYGQVEDISSLNIDKSKEMEVALRNEIQTGKAEILCSLENGKIDKYEIEIKKIYKDNNYDNKSMRIKIIDERLIEKTGGIIQGMSGSPIIQNGKFVGAVTHVIVNEPLEGYAVFGDIMIKQMHKTSN